ncbi:thiol:disulfide interchange protein DsbA [Candidatus Photodesmus blepharus]|uniref:Thiol:disulfide interchange protein n=1 Tax=Candidatus Photodesmus blepharonis TaxID=1179155 RepID=A0A084CNH7_9GAMM|nr:thiol:disulfide interchange protein DsbA/DsbL [Candidatus Photodesmus blepharus]KEY91356.1 thiol:disulfide interchange protein DsbA [Candidatus Photodesmus blepharus]
MKNFFSLGIALLMMFNLTANSANYKVNEHYKVLSSEIFSERPSIIEFFSFYCQHCSSFEAVMEKLKIKFSDNVKINKNHVSFMGGTMGKAMGKAYATMVILKIENKMVPVLFNRIHDMRSTPKNEAELRQIFLDEGIDPVQYDKVFSSFAVDGMVRFFDKRFRNANLSSVPAIIVNGRYLIQAKSVQTIDEYFDLVDYLLQLK